MRYGVPSGGQKAILLPALGRRIHDRVPTSLQNGTFRCKTVISKMVQNGAMQGGLFRDLRTSTHLANNVGNVT